MLCGYRTLPDMCKALRDWIDDNGLTLTTAAAHLGTTHASLSRYLAGKMHPTVATQRRIMTRTAGKVAPRDWADAVSDEAA